MTLDPGERGLRPGRPARDHLGARSAGAAGRLAASGWRGLAAGVTVLVLGFAACSTRPADVDGGTPGSDRAIRSDTSVSFDAEGDVDARGGDASVSPDGDAAAPEVCTLLVGGECDPNCLLRNPPAVCCHGGSAAGDGLVCGGACVDINRDASNCGGCGRVCADSWCVGGECAAPIRRDGGPGDDGLGGDLWLDAGADGDSGPGDEDATGGDAPTGVDGPGTP